MPTPRRRGGFAVISEPALHPNATLLAAASSRLILS